MHGSALADFAFEISVAGFESPTLAQSQPSRERDPLSQKRFNLVGLRLRVLTANAFARDFTGEFVQVERKL
jgi:hypothetical protein